MIRYWLDTEFIDDGRTIDLLSLGIVAEDGRDNYWQSTECNRDAANDWVRANVIPHLEHVGCSGFYGQHPCDGPDIPTCPWQPRWGIRNGLLRFCDVKRYGKPEFWGYYADYDWVAVCQLFGRMVDLPEYWPMYCRDIKQWCDQLGNPRLPGQTGEHHALADAQWNREAWLFLNERAGNT